MVSPTRLEKLLKKYTACGTLADLKRSQAEHGYVPSIYPETKPLGELMRGLREHGVRVWNGRTGQTA